jgi:hypothetical protein
LPRPKAFSADPIRRDTPGSKSVAQITHECIRPAEIEIGVAGNAKSVQGADVKAPFDVEVDTEAIRGQRSAVGKNVVTIGQRAQQLLDYPCERMFCAVAGAVTPPHRPRRR